MAARADPTSVLEIHQACMSIVADYLKYLPLHKNPNMHLDWIKKKTPKEYEWPVKDFNVVHNDQEVFQILTQWLEKELLPPSELLSKSNGIFGILFFVQAWDSFLLKNIVDLILKIHPTPSTYIYDVELDARAKECLNCVPQGSAKDRSFEQINRLFLLAPIKIVELMETIVLQSI
jgi:hypothetical protein